MKAKFLLMLFFITSIVLGQDKKIDTLSFSTNTTLLTFKGKINGVETNFAFDTGAAFGVVNTISATKSNVIIEGERKVTDSNEKSSRISKGKVNELSIGSFKLNDLKNVIYDMQFLHCNELYLLGGDAINQLNWKIDFEKKQIYVSKDPFEIQEDVLKIPIKIKGNRHFTNLNINGKKFKCLVDFGYSGFFETNYKDDIFEDLLKQSIEKGLVTESKVSSMGLTSMSVGQKASLFTTNAVSLDQFAIKNFKVEMSTNEKEPKVGLAFFNSICSSMILNISENAYFLKLNNKEINLEMGADASCYLKDGKITIISKIDNETSSAKNFEIGDEIKSVDGRSAASFVSDCQFFIWRLENIRKMEYKFEKMNGEMVTIKRQKLKTEN